MHNKRVPRLSMLKRGEVPDRVPISLSMSNYPPVLLHIASKDYFLEPKVAYEAITWMKKIFPDDSGLSYAVPEGVCWDFGGELEFPDSIGDWPIIRRLPAQTEAELKALKVPDPYSSPAVSREFQFAKIRRDAGTPGGTITLTSPFRQAVQLVGAQRLLRWIISNPNLVHHTCELTLEYSLKVAEIYVKEFGANNLSVLVTYPMETHDLISPKMFKEFSIPYALELHRQLRMLGIDSFIEHPCGKHKHNLWFWRDELNLPSHTTISVGTEIPLEEVSEYFGKDFVIGGNIDVLHLISKSPREIYDEARDVIMKMKHREGGFVLMAACVISTKVPPANISAMIEAVNDFGQY